MNISVRSLKALGWTGSLLGCLGMGMAWAGPNGPADKKPARVESKPAKPATLSPVPSAAPTSTPATKPAAAKPAPPTNEHAPGVPVGPNTNYTVQVPAISIESSSPVMCNIGKTMEHHLLVKNIGSTPAEQIEVRGTFSLTCTFLSTQPKAEVDGSTVVWRLPRLDANAQQKLSVQLKPTSTGEMSCSTTVTFSSSSALKVQVGQPKLKLVCEGPKDTLVGSDVHVMLTVINTGTGRASGVRVRQDTGDVLQASSRTAAQIEVGTLEPGESRPVETLARAREPGTMRIALVADSEDDVKASVDHTVQVRAPKLELSSTGPDFRYLNRKATYQYVISNPGDAPALNVNLSIGLPEGLQFIEATSGGFYNQQKRTVEWVPGIIEAGQKQEFAVTVLAKKEGEHLQRATAWADHNLQASAQQTVKVGGTPSVVMEVVDAEDPIETGAVTSYEIRVTNRGSKAAERVQLVAHVPDGMQPMSAEGPTKFHIEGQQVIFDELPILNAQAAATCKVKVKGTKPGTVLFRAELTSPSLTRALSAEQATEVYGE
jgi:uncharacterized repeat protein (TIGR01451 family)